MSDDERLVCLGAGVQNMLLLATALGYRTGLTSGASLQSRSFRDLFDLAPGERAICFIHFGRDCEEPHSCDRSFPLELLQHLPAAA